MALGFMRGQPGIATLAWAASSVVAGIDGLSCVQGWTWMQAPLSLSPPSHIPMHTGPNKPSRFKLRNRGADCIATIDANLGSSAFGSVVSTTNVPTRVGFGSEPHHVSANRLRG